ncbi:hypothetical protein U0M97_01440 [Streptomyces venezuelae]|nr:hypothetical protein [Streptomyces gardneri]WRK34652.1 hypothetical protein U0M97_01440 [Streptomyces venezuelae]
MWWDDTPTYLGIRRGTGQWNTPFEAVMSPAGQFQDVLPQF